MSIAECGLYANVMSVSGHCNFVVYVASVLQYNNNKVFLFYSSSYI